MMPEPDDTAVADSRRWLRDMGALLALPAMWVDHEPIEIATGLLSVLFRMLRLDGAYARFDAPQEGGHSLVSWRPSGPRLPIELGLALDGDETRASGMTTIEIDVQDLGAFRVTCLPLALPWETGLVLVSSARNDFPTAMETHLLRVAVSQAVIAIHTARRLADEHAARSPPRRHCGSTASSFDPSSTTSERPSSRSLAASEMRPASSPTWRRRMNRFDHGSSAPFRLRPPRKRMPLKCMHRSCT